MKKLNRFKTIAFTHKNLTLGELGKLHIEESQWKERLASLKSIFEIEEVMLISTCNRIEFLISWEENVSKEALNKIIKAVYPLLDEQLVERFSSVAMIFEGEAALKHLFHVASSLDSLVVGEREIITQVRNAYETCRKLNLTGDLIRLVIQKTIECAKEIYTATNIAKKPVSVVSLAYRKLRDLNVKLDSKFLIIGAGVTNTTMAKYLKKHGFTNFIVFNRTLVNGEKLAAELGGKAFPLSDLKSYKNGFDVIVTCTGSSEKIITKEIFSILVGNDTSKKVVIDLAVPNDFDEAILKNYDVSLIAVNNLQEVAKKNLQEREKELSACEKIIHRNVEEFRKEFKERIIELAMSGVPKKVKEIRETAINEIFAKDIEGLDENSKDVLDKVIAYLEKKYISVPMKMAKEILIEEVSSR